jgi:hypothetical protein
MTDVRVIPSRPSSASTNTVASSGWSVRRSLGIPDLKASLVKPDRFQILRAHPHRHPLICGDGFSAPITDLPDAPTMAKFDQAVSWEGAFSNPMPGCTDEGRPRPLGRKLG